MNTSTGLWERCAAKPGNEGRYGCPHARHDTMGKDEIAAANEKAIAAVNGNAGAALGKNRIHAAAYMKSRARLVNMLRQQERDDMNLLQDGGEPRTASEIGDDFVYISPGTSSWALTDASFLYAKSDPVSNGIHDELLAVHDKDSFVRILHSKLPAAASAIAWRVLSDQGKTVDLSKDDTEKLLRDADKCGTAILAYKVFDDYKDKFTTRELVDMAGSMSISRQYVTEVLRRDPDELLNGDGMSLNVARTCMALHKSNRVKDIPGPVLDKAWEKLDYDVQSNYDHDTYSYAKIIEDKSLSDKTAAGIAHSAAVYVSKCDLTANPDGDKDIERYGDGTMNGECVQVAGQSSIRVSTIEAYSKRKNHSDEVMRELFAHGCFMSGYDDISQEDEWPSTYVMNMSEKDAKMLVYGVKHGYLTDERILDLARADDHKAHLFVESSANRSLPADVRKQLRAMIKKNNPFAGM